MGFKLDEKQLNQAFTRFKDMADKKKDIYDDDLRIIVQDEIRVEKPVWKLGSFEVISGTMNKPSAVVILSKKGKLLPFGKSNGDGPIDACFKAIDKIVGLKAKLEDFRLEAVTPGKDALGHVNLKLLVKKVTYSGSGSSTDIIEAAVRAYIDAVNKIESK
jgi:2-isopropylmalate synthase